ncbi:flagellar basal body rod protein FlgB [Microvirga thermotolerans]|uniref:Flagellar basal body rod protein FlgB n=1 Tax=Microvirga thermotolerans TaxID=2651334 RepID=A0A5P9K2B6_9HYPH|nr:flagellar basal body rod protein FlgB [Microvirga thermotolerans]QFU18198.1 flagellar basal body rod protein FlgB [Microvirga thermotolerans]
MGDIYLFDVASRQAQWLSVRQATISSNIANANTPGFKAKDVEPFSKVFDRTHLTMAATSKAHLGFDEASVRPEKVRKSESWDTVHSGNSVSIEQEMIKAGEINREYSLNTGIVKAFHRMLLASTRSGQ